MTSSPGTPVSVKSTHPGCLEIPKRQFHAQQRFVDAPRPSGMNNRTVLFCGCVCGFEHIFLKHHPQMPKTTILGIGSQFHKIRSFPNSSPFYEKKNMARGAPPGDPVRQDSETRKLPSPDVHRLPLKEDPIHSSKIARICAFRMLTSGCCSTLGPCVGTSSNKKGVPRTGETALPPPSVAARTWPHRTLWPLWRQTQATRTAFWRETP